MSCFDDRVFVGLELGYFTGKTIFRELPFGGDSEVVFPAEFGNIFGACNVMLRHYCTERMFWYGGVGAGIVCVSMTANIVVRSDDPDSGFFRGGVKSWSFWGQGFTGFGLCLNDNWQLTIGYRLRYVSGNVIWKLKNNPDDAYYLKMKQDLSHAAEIGLTYRF